MKYQVTKALRITKVAIDYLFIGIIGHRLTHIVTPLRTFIDELKKGEDITTAYKVATIVLSNSRYMIKIAPVKGIIRTNLRFIKNYLSEYDTYYN